MIIKNKNYILILFFHNGYIDIIIIIYLNLFKEYNNIYKKIV